MLENCFQNMNCFPWIKLMSVLIHLKYFYYNIPYLDLPLLLPHPCQIFPWPTDFPLQCNPHHVLHRFLYFLLPNSITRHNYWIYQIVCQAKPIRFILKLYANHNNTSLIKHATYQKTESLRAASLSKLDNTVVSNNYLFNTKCPEFSTEW